MYRVEEMKNVSLEEEEEEEEDLERVKREVESKHVKREDRGRQQRQLNWEWLQEMAWFVSKTKTIKWLTPRKVRHGEKIN